MNNNGRVPSQARAVSRLTRRRALGVFAACGTVALVLASCSSSPATPAASSSTPFRVLFIDGLSGGFAPIGNGNLAGMNAAVSVINSEGGILGHKVELTSKDDQASPQDAVNILQASLSSGPTPNLVYAGGSSTENLALLPILTQKKILSVEQGGSTQLSDGTTFPYNFTTAPLPSYEYTAIGDYFQSKGIKSVGVISSNDALGASEIALMEPAFKKLGITYSIQQYSDTALDMTPQLEALKATNAGGLVVIGYGTPIPHIINNLTTLGWNVPVVGNLAVSATPLTTLVPLNELSNTQLIALILQKYKPIDQQTANVAKGLRAILAQGPITQPIYTYSLSYDALQLVALAAKNAGSIQTAAIVRALNHLKAVSNPPYISLPVMTYTSTLHAPAAPPQYYIFAPANSSVKDGMFNG